MAFISGCKTRPNINKDWLAVIFIYKCMHRFTYRFSLPLCVFVSGFLCVSVGVDMFVLVWVWMSMDDCMHLFNRVNSDTIQKRSFFGCFLIHVVGYKL